MINLHVIVVSIRQKNRNKTDKNAHSLQKWRMIWEYTLNVFSSLYTDRMVRWWHDDPPVYNIVKIRGKIKEKLKIYIYTHYKSSGESGNISQICSPTCGKIQA